MIAELPLRRFFCVLLCALIPPQFSAQQPARRLTIKILEGNDVINYFNQRTAQEPIVQVEDENRKPVAGALVTFALPGNGPSGFFTNAARTLSVTTDSNGQAVATGLRANGTQGQFQIAVNASYAGHVATTVIMQTNQKPPASLKSKTSKSGISGKAIAIVTVVAGAAAAGAVVALNHGKSSTPAGPPPSTTVTAGTTTVGPPR